MRSTFPTLLEVALLAALSKAGEEYSEPLREKASSLLGRPQVLATVHTSLRRLVTRKMLKSTMRKQQGRRTCRMFKITASGRKGLVDVRKSLARLGK